MSTKTTITLTREEAKEKFINDFFESMVKPVLVNRADAMTNKELEVILDKFNDYLNGVNNYIVIN